MGRAISTSQGGGGALLDIVAVPPVAVVALNIYRCGSYTGLVEYIYRGVVTRIWQSIYHRGVCRRFAWGAV